MVFVLVGNFIYNVYSSSSYLRLLNFNWHNNKIDDERQRQRQSEQERHINDQEKKTFIHWGWFSLAYTL